MILEVENEEVFSWEQFRKERRQSEKTKQNKRRSTRKSKRSSDANPELSKDTVLKLDVSDRTGTTMADSMSTISSVPEVIQVVHDTPNNRVVDLQEDNVLDHVVLAASDLDDAIAEFQQKTGVLPVKTGHINGLGITKARVAMEGSSFLEIIAPDPEREGPIGTLLKSTDVKGLVPFHWAIRKSNAEALAPEAARMGYTPDFIRMKGPDEDGTIKKWETLYLYGHPVGGMCPLFINWDTFDHPCEYLPVVGRLVDVTVRAPSKDKVHNLMAHAGSTGFTLTEGKPHFEVKFESPKGIVTFAAEEMTGFKIPGLEEAKKEKQAAKVAPAAKRVSVSKKTNEKGGSKQAKRKDRRPSSVPKDIVIPRAVCDVEVPPNKGSAKQGGIDEKGANTAQSTPVTETPKDKAIEDICPGPRPIPTHAPQLRPPAKFPLQPSRDRPAMMRTAGNGKRSSLVVPAAQPEGSLQGRPGLGRTAGTGKRKSLVGAGGLKIQLSKERKDSNKNSGTKRRSSLVELPTTVEVSESDEQSDPDSWDEDILMYPIP